MSSSHLNAWFVFQHDQLILYFDHHHHTLPTTDSIQSLLPKALRQHLLGEYQQHSCYCMEISKETVLPPYLQAVPLRKAFELLTSNWYSVAVRAYSIINWDNNHQFCGRCGALTLHQSPLFERYCPLCHLTFYPRISPSVIVLIQRGDYILMARSPHFLPGIYGLIAGFVEAGETVEETLHREVREEVGIEINNLTYCFSQAWPFPDSLMLGFFADYASGEIVIDQKEIEAADWYRYDQLPTHSLTSISISKKLIDYYLAKKTLSSPNIHPPRLK